MTTTFNTLQYELLYGDGIESTYWTLARNNIIFNSIKRAGLENIPFIEVGCGRGVVTKSLLERNIDCFGVELADVKPLYGLENKIVTGKDAVDFDEEFRQKFKGILLFDVIEHIEDDNDFIKKLLHAYKNVEYLVITVPARKEIWSNFDEFNHHFRRYDLKMIRTLLGNMDFEILECRYFFSLIYFCILLQNKLRIKRKIKMPIPKSKPAKMLNNFLASCFILEHLVMPGKLYGSSIICIARKKK